MKEKYRYFITYDYVNNKEDGIGCVIVLRQSKIKSLDDIKALAEDIRKKYNFSSISIIKFSRLKECWNASFKRKRNLYT